LLWHPFIVVFWLAGAPPRSALDVHGTALFAFFVISLAAATYDRAATEAEAALGAEKQKSNEHAGLLRRMFGRYLSPEVMEALVQACIASPLSRSRHRCSHSSSSWSWSGGGARSMRAP
jgi:hypothetical protein